MSKSVKILIVEDNEDDLYLSKRVLLKEGIRQIYHAGDGQQAINYLRKAISEKNSKTHPLPDVILIDIKMPEIGGHEVAEWIKSQPKLANMRRYMLSSSGEEKDRSRAEAACIDGYFVKPLTSADVQGFTK